VDLKLRLLEPGDEGMLRLLADEEADFGLDEPSGLSRALADADAEAYLRDPGVLHWVAEEDGLVLGHLLAYVERRRANPPRQLLLYDIGVREASRRRGVGTALVDAMREWMRAKRVEEAWVPADSPEAEAFYAACGFVRDEEQPVQMTLRL
jgi:GNAT superfamily N-acetyltransferase